MNDIDQRIRRARNTAGGEIVPIWERGQEQPTPHDLRKFAEEGYSKNSLIYSCVREIATSFAPLRANVQRNGQVVERHRMSDLLADPNTGQDAAEFQDEIATHYQAAGNAYIEKVRESTSRDRRRQYGGYPVQELVAIRPDKVTVEPGATREDDVFLVTVGGQVRKRIPRADMIHVREPNLINDYYGLSKIALLTREGSIDLEMSDLELAFFRNAGVPMGLLTVKGRPTDIQTEEIKSKFKRAFSGFRSWFDVLVLNESVTDYKPLGLPPKDMEGESTRFHVESRICGVFGVPGLLVGARFALTSAQQGNYEQAQLQFWSETMVPLAGYFASAWQKELLPEFATTRDRGAVVAYDFTGVRALQEDVSRKLREVTRLINAGWVVNDALRIVGLDELPDGDIRILTGNQVIVDREGNVVYQTAAPSGGSTEPNPDNPLEGAAQVAIQQIERGMRVTSKTQKVYRDPEGRIERVVEELRG